MLVSPHFIQHLDSYKLIIILFCFAENKWKKNPNTLPLPLSVQKILTFVKKIILEKLNEL